MDQKQMDEMRALFDAAVHALNCHPPLYDRGVVIGSALGKIPALLDELERERAENAILEKRLEFCPCWCNDCEYGHISEDGITCVNINSEWCTEWRGTYDSCEQCKWRDAPQDNAHGTE